MVPKVTWNFSNGTKYALDIVPFNEPQVPVTFDDEGHNPCTLRMMGVPYKTDTQELKDFFADHAECLDVRVLLNRDGFPSGRGFPQQAIVPD